jgi:hypothetical protein
VDPIRNGCKQGLKERRGGSLVGALDQFHEGETSTLHRSERAGRGGDRGLPQAYLAAPR